MASNAAWETAINGCSGMRRFRQTTWWPGEPRGVGWREEQKTAWIHDSARQDSCYQRALQGALAVSTTAGKLCGLTDCSPSYLPAIQRSAALSPWQATCLAPAGPISRIWYLLNCKFWRSVLVFREKIKMLFSHFRLLSLKNNNKKIQTPTKTTKTILQKTSMGDRDLTAAPEAFCFRGCRVGLWTRARTDGGTSPDEHLPGRMVFLNQNQFIFLIPLLSYL